MEETPPSSDTEESKKLTAEQQRKRRLNTPVKSPAHKRAEQALQRGEKPPRTVKEGRRRRNRNTRVGHGANLALLRAQRRLAEATAERETAQQASTYLNNAVDIVAEALQRAENLPNVLAEFRGELVELGLESAQPYADEELQRHHAVWLQVKAQIEADSRKAAEKQRAAAAEAKRVAAELKAVEVDLLSVTARRSTVQTRLGQLQQQQRQEQKQQQQAALSQEIEAERKRIAKGWTFLDAAVDLLKEKEHLSQQDLDQREQRFQQHMDRREQRFQQDMELREQQFQQDMERRQQHVAEWCQEQLLEVEHAWAELQQQAAALRAKEAQFAEQQRQFAAQQAAREARMAAQQMALDERQAQLEAEAPPNQRRGAYKKFSKLGSERQAQLLAAFEKMSKGDEIGFIKAYLQRSDHKDQLLSLVLSLKHLVMDSLDEKLRQRILAGGEKLPVERAIALRLALLLSDERYSMLSRFAPGWLPSLTALREAEERLLPPMVQVISNDKHVGWQLANAADLLKEAVKAHVAAGGQGCNVQVKVGTDNFGHGRKKLGTLVNYQQVAAVPMFATSPPAKQPDQPHRSRKQLNKQLKQQQQREQQQTPAPLAPCPPIPVLRPSAVAAADGGGYLWTAEELLQQGIPVEDVDEIGLLLSSYRPVDSPTDLAELLAGSAPGSPRPPAPAFPHSCPCMLPICGCLKFCRDQRNFLEQLGCDRTLLNMMREGSKYEKAVQAVAMQRVGLVPVGGAKAPQGKDTEGMKYAPLTPLEPDTCVMEELHCRLNIIKTHLDHTTKLAAEKKVELAKVVENVVGFKRPVTGYEGDQCRIILKRRGEWLRSLDGHPSYQAIRQRWDLIAALVTLTHMPNPTDRQVEQFRLLADYLGRHLLLHWGEEAAVPYTFHFYDHALLCHAYGQLRRYKSLFKFSTWYLEHMNKWWKRFLIMHSSHGGGSNPLAADITKQCLRKFVLVTHPAVRGEVEHVLERRRGEYRCGGCGGVKSRGHTRTCVKAMKLKLLNLERKQRGEAPLAFLPAEYF